MLIFDMSSILMIEALAGRHEDVVVAHDLCNVVDGLSMLCPTSDKMPWRSSSDRTIYAARESFGLNAVPAT